MPAAIRQMFENYVKDRFDLDACISVNNGTSALIAPLWSMDLMKTNLLLWRWIMVMIYNQMKLKEMMLKVMVLEKLLLLFLLYNH